MTIQERKDDRMVNSIKVLTVGVFDLLHFGHFELLRRCKDIAGATGQLIGAIQNDCYVTKYKPEARLVYDWKTRANMIRALRYVDEVVSYDDVDESIKHIDFDVFVVGGDQMHAGFQRAIRWCEDNGKTVVRLTRTEGISSSLLRKGK